MCRCRYSLCCPTPSSLPALIAPGGCSRSPRWVPLYLPAQPARAASPCVIHPIIACCRQSTGLHKPRARPCLRQRASGRRQVGFPPDDGPPTPGTRRKAPHHGACHDFRRATAMTKTDVDVPSGHRRCWFGHPLGRGGGSPLGRSCTAPIGGRAAREWHPHSTQSTTSFQPTARPMSCTTPPLRIGERPQRLAKNSTPAAARQLLRRATNSARGANQHE